MHTGLLKGRKCVVLSATYVRTKWPPFSGPVALVLFSLIAMTLFFALFCFY